MKCCNPLPSMLRKLDLHHLPFLHFHLYHHHHHPLSLLVISPLCPSSLHIFAYFINPRSYIPQLTGRILGILREETYSEEWCTIYEKDRLLFFPLSLSLFFSSLIILLLYLPLHRSITPLPRGLFLENGKRVRSLLPLAKRDLI